MLTPTTCMCEILFVTEKPLSLTFQVLRFSVTQILWKTLKGKARQWKKTRTCVIYGTDILFQRPTSCMPPAKRKSELCQVLLALLQFWQEKQLHCSQIKGKHTLYTSFPASFLSSLMLFISLHLYLHLYCSSTLQPVPTVLTWQP